MAFTPLNALNSFLAVARRQSFAAAASELGVSPSSLSQSVRQLETRLGVTLLSRTTRSVSLTDAGRRLLEQAGPGIQQAMDALKGSSARPGEVTGRVRLTVLPLAWDRVIAPILPRFAARFPAIEVEVQVENRRANIVAEGFDGGITLEEFVARDMVHVRLTGAARFVVGASPRYVKKRGAPQTPRDLAAHNCICYRSPNTGRIWPWDLERGKRTWRVPVRGTYITNDERVVLSLTEAGIGLGYIFEPDMTAQLKNGSLQIVLEDYAASVPGFFLYFPSRTQVSPAFRAFIDTARETMARSR
ncbi:LysR family transcriptional regulator [Pendulispora rubella]|uniref:LysR family transcriptional regulator n=1 Tax=Pendulispora rubella TaxID=2741070 RepID=A0ABZ2L327_9BACT